jgi:hypothetical protein
VRFDGEDDLSGARSERRVALDKSARFCHLRQAYRLQADIRHKQRSPATRTKMLAVASIVTGKNHAVRNCSPDHPFRC